MFTQADDFCFCIQVFLNLYSDHGNYMIHYSEMMHKIHVLAKITKIKYE